MHGDKPRFSQEGDHSIGSNSASPFTEYHRWAAQMKEAQNYSRLYTGILAQMLKGCDRLRPITNDRNSSIIASHSSLKQLVDRYDERIDKAITHISNIKNIREKYRYTLMDKDIGDSIAKILNSHRNIQQKIDQAISDLEKNRTPTNLRELNTEISCASEAIVQLEWNIQGLMDACEELPDTQSEEYKQKMDYVNNWLQSMPKE